MEKINKETNHLPHTNKHSIYRILLFIPFLLYLPGILGWIAYPTGEGNYTDLLLTHYPYALFLKNAIIRDLAIPFWSNLIYSGFPFAANPLSGLWYLPGWSALLFPLPEGINIALAIHSVFGAWGLYKLLRAEKVNIEGAIFGGVAFGILPKIAIHYGAGHVTLLYSIAWSPWLFLISKSDRKGWKTGLVAGLLFLADPRWAVLIGVLWLVYDIAHREFISIKGIYFYLQSILIAFLVASPLIIPLLEYVRLSTRATLTQSERLIYSLPPEKLLGLIIPVSGGNIEWFSYPGGILFGLLILLLSNQKLRKTNRIWLAGVGISILVALGSYLPGYSFITELPLVSLLRVPARALFITSFCLVIIAAKTFEQIVKKEISENSLKTIAFGLLVFSFIFGMGLAFSINENFLQATWGCIALGVSSLALILFTKDKRKRNILAWILMAILIIDLSGSSLLNIRFKHKSEVLTEKQILLRYLGNDTGRFRVYSPSYSVPQYLSAAKNLELADGVDPMQLIAYVDFMEEATGVGSSDYAVTIPSFSTGNPAIDNIEKIPNPYLLGLLNVKYLASEFPIVSEGLVLIDNYSDTYLYENKYLLPRTWIQKTGTKLDEIIEGEVITNAEITTWNPNKIVIEAEGPGTLILSEINYPGWTVIVDGKKENIQSAFKLLRSVEIGEGKQEIVFTYRPWSIYIGMILATMGWVYCSWTYFRKK